MLNNPCRLCRRQLLVMSRSPRALPRSLFTAATFPRPIDPAASSSSTLSRCLPARSPSRQVQQQRRSVVLHATPPLEAPEEPLGSDAVIDLTESAMAQIARAQAKSGNQQLALRVSVESGGCHGYQYKMEVTDRREDDDYLFEPSTSSARLLIDSSSLGLLSGSTIDYATELIGSSFRITGNPHASDKGGCGCGVSWELKEDTPT